jgi:hypothetical protein
MYLCWECWSHFLRYSISGLRAACS